MTVKEVMIKEIATLDVNDELSLANDIMRLGRIAIYYGGYTQFSDSYLGKADRGLDA